MKKKLTALLITLNGERVLEKCLSSLAFCDQILVVDSFSTDATEEICLAHGAMFITHKFPGYFEQIQYGMDWLAENAPTEWIFFLDCDEIVTEDLRQSILAAIDTPNDCTAFSVPRCTWYYDRFLKHGGMYPDRLFRLFTPQGIHLSEYHGHPTYTPQGKNAPLDGDLLHFSYSSFYNNLEKLNTYAQRGAESMKKSGKKGGILSGMLHAFWRFICIYCLKLGILDGKAGFICAAHHSFYTFLKYIRMDEGLWGFPYDAKPKNRKR